MARSVLSIFLSWTEISDSEIRSVLSVFLLWTGMPDSWIRSVLSIFLLWAGISDSGMVARFFFTLASTSLFAPWASF